MKTYKFFLDTGAIIALSGLKAPNLQAFKSRTKSSNSKLSTTHVQVDEKHPKELKNYYQKINRALKSLRQKGIVVHVEATREVVFDVSRFNLAKFGDKELGKLDDELRKEIDACERAKGTIKPPLNIARDALIAVSSLDHDFFVTCDKCLSQSWNKVIGKHIMLNQRFTIPRAVYIRPIPEDVAKQILSLLP